MLCDMALFIAGVPVSCFGMYQIGLKSVLHADQFNFLTPYWESQFLINLALPTKYCHVEREKKLLNTSEDLLHVNCDYYSL